MSEVRNPAPAPANGSPPSYGTAASNVPSSFERARRQILDFLLPAPCLACRSPLEDPQSDPGLCAACWQRLPTRPAQYCRLCARPLGAQGVGNPSCGPCRRRPPAYDRLFWGWVYGPPLDAALGALKFGRLDYLAERLGRRLADEVAPELAGTGVPIDGVVPVPLHWSRHLARGYDQAELLARAVGRTLGLPVLPALRRRRRTPPQSRLDRRQRRRNLDRAFTLRRDFDAAAHGHLLLVDDVTTTGTTLGAAADVLKRAGASWIGALTVAHTPQERLRGS